MAGGVVTLTLLISCARPAPAQSTVGADTPKTGPVFSHPKEITNTYLPLSLLKQDILSSKHERVERTAKPEIQKVIEFQGKQIDALVVEDREIVDGKIEEITLDYFAQADDGTVYYLGEGVDEYKDGMVSGHSGAWMLGKNTQTPGVLMPGNPKVGDKFQSENVPNVTVENDEVISVSETVKVKGGKYKNCLKIKEMPSDGKPEYKFYAKGVGVVREVESDGKVELESHTMRNSSK